MMATPTSVYLNPEGIYNFGLFDEDSQDQNLLVLPDIPARPSLLAAWIRFESDPVQGTSEASSAVPASTGVPVGSFSSASDIGANSKKGGGQGGNLSPVGGGGLRLVQVDDGQTIAAAIAAGQFLTDSFLLAGKAADTLHDLQIKFGGAPTGTKRRKQARNQLNGTEAIAVQFFGALDGLSGLNIGLFLGPVA